MIPFTRKLCESHFYYFTFDVCAPLGKIAKKIANEKSKTVCIRFFKNHFPYFFHQLSVNVYIFWNHCALPTKWYEIQEVPNYDCWPQLWPNLTIIHISSAARQFNNFKKLKWKFFENIKKYINLWKV